jgi:hypothetical protein
MSGYQSCLDDYLEGGEPRRKTMRRDAEECTYCGVPSFRLHGGAMCLWVDGGAVRVRADVDHVYHKCVEGLKENIVFLYGVLMDLKARGYDVLAVGKAYDDDLYAWITTVPNPASCMIDYKGFTVKLLWAKSIAYFTKTMDEVDEGFIRDVLS